MHPSLRVSVIGKTARITRERLAARDARLVDERRSARATAPLAAALRETLARAPD